MVQNRRLLLFALFVTSGVPILGCHSWYWVESEYRGKTLETAPEIARTSKYGDMLGRDISVALSAPDKCADRTAAESSGGPLPAGELIGTTCGVEMAELERALVEAGFRVVSWNAIRHMVLYEEHVTPLEAAQQLDADVLFQVNSLERSVARPAKEVAWERTFYKWELNPFQWLFGAGSNGHKGAVAQVPYERAAALEREMRYLESSALGRGQVSVTVNATAIHAATGETLWFYSWTKSEKATEVIRRAQLFECHRSNMSRCLRRTPAARPDVAAPPPRSGSRGRHTEPSRDASPSDATYYRLIREVIEDLVARFANPSA